MSIRIRERKISTPFGKEWWASLSFEEQQSYIHNRERRRRSTAPKRAAGYAEYLPEGNVKIWNKTSGYSVYKPHMIPEEYQHIKPPTQLTIKEEL